jgi:hypothetical protein
MSAWLIVAVGLAYACVAVEQAWKGNWAMSLVFGGYAVSNIGLLKVTS